MLWGINPVTIKIEILYWKSLTYCKSVFGCLRVTVVALKTNEISEFTLYPSKNVWHKLTVALLVVKDKLEIQRKNHTGDFCNVSYRPFIGVHTELTTVKYC